MLMILVQSILHKTPNRLLQYHLGVQLDLCIFGALPPIQHFSNDMSINDAKWTFAPDVLASSITSFLLLPFVRFHAEIFSDFPNSLSTAPFAAGIFRAWEWGKRINLWTKLQCCSELSPFCCNMVFLMSRQWFSQTQSCRFTSFQNTRKFWFDFIECITLDVGCFLVNLLPDHKNSFGGFSSKRPNWVKPVHGSDKSLDPSIFQQSSMRFSYLTTKLVWVVLDTSMYFSGIGNDSSLGEWSLTLGSTWWRYMKFPDMDQKSFIASPTSGNES